jgi:hypothetical protein
MINFDINKSLHSDFLKKLTLRYFSHIIFSVKYSIKNKYIKDI